MKKLWMRALSIFTIWTIAIFIEVKLGYNTDFLQGYFTCVIINY